MKTACLSALMCLLCARLEGAEDASAQSKIPAPSCLTIREDEPVESLLRQGGARSNAPIQWDMWGLPLGNGRLGAVFYGSVQDDLVQFNEDSLWTGGDKAIKEVEAFIQQHVWPNGLSCINTGAHTGKGDKFQIDANLGCPAAIYEMLMQSHSGVLHLLPALPANFPTGSVRGIRARDGCFIDLSWDKGKLTRAVIHSTTGKPCKVRCGDKSATLNINKDGSVVVDKNVNVIG